MHAPSDKVSKPANTLIEALLDHGAIHPDSLVKGAVPPTGTIELLEPMHSTDFFYDGPSSDLPYTIKAEYLWELNNTLQANGLVDFEYINSGADAIVFSAKNLRYQQQKENPANPLRSEYPVLRIHLGPPHPARENCPDVIGAVNEPITIHDAITCEEVEYLNVPPPGTFDLKIVLGLAISCLANGWSFEDSGSGGSNNIIQRRGDPRVGILEPQAVTRLPDDDTSTAAFYTERFLRYIGNKRYMHDASEIRARSNAARNPSSRVMDTQYSQGDVIETLSNTVVILNGDFYKSNYSTTINQHPRLEERRKLVTKILADEHCTNYSEFMDEFIVIPQPNNYPPDDEKLFKSMSLANKLRTALNDHEQARLDAVSAASTNSPGYLNGLLNETSVNQVSTGTSIPNK